MNAASLFRAALRPLLVALPAMPVWGQAPRSDSSGLEEITVTATRMERSLREVPAAVSVVDMADVQLGRQQISLDESLSRVPGAFMQNRYNFAQDLRVSIRGFGARSSFGIRGIKILVDGIPETLPDGQGQVDNVDIGATQQIEILRGPSSALYGNAAGGVIAITTEAGPETPYAELRLSGGAGDFQKVQVKGGGRTDAADYFVSLSDTHFDGFREQSEYRNTQLTGRARFDLSQGRELLAVLNVTDQPIADDPGGITRALAIENPDAAAPANVDFDAGEALEQTRLGFVYRMPLGGPHTLTARNYYVWRDFSNSLPFADGGIVTIDRQFMGGGLAYHYDGIWLDFPNRLVVGIDYDDQDDDRRRYGNVAGVPGALSFDQNEYVTSLGVFVQNELSFSEDFQLSFGLRLDEVRFDVTDRYLSDGDDSGERTLRNSSPMLGLTFGLNPTTSLYASYGMAFETPTTTEFNRPDGGGGFNPNLEPQQAESFELGIRGMAGPRGRYEMAVYHIDVEDELIPFEVPSSPGRDFFENAGESVRRGLELSWESDVTDRISALLTYTYSDFEFERFVTEDGDDFSGNRLPGTVEHLAFGELSYTHPRGWFGVVDALYAGEQYADNANTTITPSYTLVSLRLGLERELNGIVIAPFLGVNNLLDERYFSNVRINAFGGRYFEPGPPRHLYGGVSLRRSFR